MLGEIPQFIPSHQKKSLFSATVRFGEGQRSCVFDSLFKNIYQNFDYSNGDSNVEANDRKH